jgi:hypothetical protein
MTYEHAITEEVFCAGFDRDKSLIRVGAMLSEMDARIDIQEVIKLVDETIQEYMQ